LAKRASRPIGICTSPNQEQKAKQLKIMIIKMENHPLPLVILRLSASSVSECTEFKARRSNPVAAQPPLDELQAMFFLPN
jgi:hypothetical protein